MSTATVGTDANFVQEVINVDGSVLVDFSGYFSGFWSEPCRTMAAMLEEIVADCDGALKVVRVDVDEHNYLAAQHGIRSIPTLILYWDGRPVERIVGPLSKRRLMRVIGPYVGWVDIAPAMLDTAASVG